MTKGELDKEAGESWWNDNNCSGALSTKKIYICGYLAGAEPREKRIAELEKELEQAKKVQVVEHFEAYGQCRDSRRIVSLEKENAELEAQIEKLKSCSNCIHYSSTFGLCHYSMGDEDYDCRGRKWEIKEK